MGELIIETWIERTSHMLECNKGTLRLKLESTYLI